MKEFMVCFKYEDLVGGRYFDYEDEALKDARIIKLSMPTAEVVVYRSFAIADIPVAVEKIER